MSAITSELYMKSSSLVDEKICVGLFVIDGENVFFDYSKNKFKIALKLDPSLDNSATLHWLENLKEKIKRDHSNEEFGFFRSDFNSATLGYLNTYSKGVFHFSEPKPISASIDRPYFVRLFKRMVDSEMSESGRHIVASMPSFKSEFRSIIKRESFESIDIAYKVEPKVLSGIYTPHKVEFIGKNGSFIAGDTVDFNTKPATIEKSLFEFDRIAKGLKALAAKNNFPNEGEYYAYFSMPEDEDGKQVLDLAMNDGTKNFVLKELDHLERLADHIENEAYRKFSEWIDSLHSV
jgi:hypothetical protein